MYGFLMVLFILLCIVLGFFILIQQGKGDMGLGALGGGSQMLFGGSGGQEFFQRTTWILGAIFIFGSLGLAILKSKEIRQSRLGDFVTTQKIKREQAAPVAKDVPVAPEAQATQESKTPEPVEKK